MELASLFNLLENIIDDIPQCLYEKLRQRMKVRKFNNAKIILDYGGPILYFYYLKKGLVTSLNKDGNMVWFCEENEIILFNKFSYNNFSSYNIVAEKIV